MMQVELFAGLLELAIYLFALAGVFRLLRLYFIDALRERLFTIREDLFDYAADGSIGFDDPAYVKLRLVFNSLIRFADHLTGTRLLLLVVSSKVWTAPDNLDWHHSFDSLSLEQRRRLVDLHAQATRAVAEHLMRTSLVPWFLLAVYMVKGTPKRADDHQVPGVEMLETQAVAVESSSLGAGAGFVAVA